MAEPLAKPWTVEDFLEWEAQQPERYEFTDGMIVMMVAGSVAHATIRDNLLAALRARLDGGPCRAFSQELKVTTGTSLLYPDLAVTRVPVEPREDRLREPAIIVEVLSPSTADRDRGAKWLAYQEIPSLEHYGSRPRSIAASTSSRALRTAGTSKSFGERPLGSNFPRSGSS